MAKLENNKHEMFCLEYVKDCNGTQAAIRCGYSKKTAGAQAGRLLQNVKINARIAELIEEAKTSKIADATEVMERLTAILRGEADEEVIVGTPIGAETVIKKIGGREQVKAAELLAKRYGLLTDNVKLTGAAAVQIVDDLE